MLGQIRRSLVAQLLLILLLTAGLALAASAALAFRAARTHLLDYVRGNTNNTADLVRLAAHDGMLLNRPDVVQTTLRNLVSGPAVAAIRVYDKKGAIVMSAHESEVGQTVGLDSETCQSCHAQGRASDVALLEKSALVRGAAGIRSPAPPLRDSERAGVRAPELSRAALPDQDSRRAGRRGLDAAAGAGDARYPCPARLDHRRADRRWWGSSWARSSGASCSARWRGSVQGTKRIAAGDLETRIEVSGEHDLARLAEAFNRMAEELVDGPQAK